MDRPDVHTMVYGRKEYVTPIMDKWEMKSKKWLDKKLWQWLLKRNALTNSIECSEKYYVIRFNKKEILSHLFALNKGYRMAKVIAIGGEDMDKLRGEKTSYRDMHYNGTSWFWQGIEIKYLPWMKGIVVLEWEKY